MTDAALAPLHAALLARARAEAEQVRAAAERDERDAVAAAEAAAAALLADARAHGEADAAALLAVERGRAHRAARAALLDAQRELYEELRRQAAAEVARVLAGPDATARLVATTRDRLGDDATIRASADGGVLAQTPAGRRLDASVAALVDRALVGLDLEQLWAPQ